MYINKNNYEKKKKHLTFGYPFIFSQCTDAWKCSLMIQNHNMFMGIIVLNIMAVALSRHQYLRFQKIIKTQNII